jgi:hypothetical protein
LPLKITDIIDAYQKEVEPDFLRAENRRLQEEIMRLQAHAAEQQRKIDHLTTQDITGVPRLAARPNEQQRRANPTLDNSQTDEDYFSLAQTLNKFVFFPRPEAKHQAPLGGSAPATAQSRPDPVVPKKTEDLTKLLPFYCWP